LVTLGSNAVENDIVEIHVYRSFILADALKASGDTMAGELEVPTVKLSSNVIKASDGGSTITLDTSDNVTIGGDLKVGAIKASDGTAGISIADSTGRITVTETNPSITLGSNATFPAGHVIQTKTDTYDPAGRTDVTTTADDVLGNNLQVTITPNSTSNELIVTCFIGNLYNYGEQNHCLSAGFKYHADWTGTPTTLGSREFVTEQHLRLASSTIMMGNVYFMTITNAPVGTQIIIRPWFQTDDGDMRLFDGYAKDQASLVVQEIQA